MHGNLHSRTENALIAVGSVGATIIVFFVFWLAWKFYKMHRKRGGGGGTGGGVSSMNWRRPNLPASLSMEKPKRLLINVVARVPILKDRVAKRSWSNLEKPYDNSFWETRFADPNERKRTSSRITVHTAITTKSEREGPDSLGLPRQAPGRSAAASFQPTPRSKRQMSVLSDISSLSSGFGDGDIVMPPANSTATTTITTAQLAVPQPVAQRVSVSEASHRRDTMYTEASEDPVPRFRTINSWVRQQSGRIKRAKQREPDAPPVPSMPPEQEFRLMMPDDEEPRRVEEAEQEQFEAKR
ncbi:hypothetical protein CDD83_7702 [Cordyceps sp. RAO-2017]|nr:hypothetical protein CDD83_7702 [Cordyceps sp. RAO-2017]